MEKIKYFAKKPHEIIRVLGAKGFLRWIPDRPFLCLMFYLKLGKKLNLKNPRSFNEKLQWLKLYDRNPLYTDMVDKYKVRDYVSKKIGEKYLIPLLGVWDDPDKIDFDKLPDRFVIKCNHNSGTVIICKDKSELDVEQIKKILKKKLKKNFYYGGREWPYKNVKPKVICEKYMENENTHGLTDYKIYCFNGEPKLLMIATNRFTKEQTHFDYFDCEFNWLDLDWDMPRSEIPPIKPAKLEDMIKIASKLSEGIPQVRVDLYEVDEMIYFGEMTFFDGSGFQKMRPDKWDYILGSWIELPYKEKKGCK